MLVIIDGNDWEGKKNHKLILNVLILQTTDVQTASLVIVNCVPHIPSEVSKDARVLSWIEK